MKKKQVEDKKVISTEDAVVMQEVVMSGEDVYERDVLIQSIEEEEEE